MKILSILAIVFSFTQCGSTKFEQNPPFSIEKAEYYGWVGGQPGVRGINVKIQLKENSAIAFDSLYFKNRATKIEINSATLLVANYNTSKKNASDIILDVDPRKEIKNEVPKSNFPFELENNEAVLSYQLGGKTHYYRIKNLKETDTSSSSKIK